MIGLDWFFFGNGRGMASPYFDDAFYWLHDLNHGRDRRGRHSRLYRWLGGFGAQLTSYEWRTPKPGSKRCLFGHEFVIFQTSRKWIRVECSWAVTGQLRSVEDIAGLREKLRLWGHG